MNLYVKIGGNPLLLVVVGIIADKVLMGCIISQRRKVPSTLEKGLAYLMHGFRFTPPVEKAA